MLMIVSAVSHVFSGHVVHFPHALVHKTGVDNVTVIVLNNEYLNTYQ